MRHKLVEGDMATVIRVLRCRACTNHVCETCSGHSLPYTGPYVIIDGMILCPHCAADKNVGAPRCDECSGTQIMSTGGSHKGQMLCACSTAKPACDGDAYDPSEEGEDGEGGEDDEDGGQSSLRPSGP